MSTRETLELEKSTREYLEPEESKQFEAAATSLRDKLLFRLLRVLACRISEVLALCVENFNFRRQRVTIIHLKARVNLTCPHCGKPLAKAHTFCPKCGQKVDKAIKEEQEHRRQRQLPIDAETLGLVKEYIARGGQVTRDGHQFLFNISRQRAWQIFREYQIRLGLPDLVNTETGKLHHVGPHKMRDSFATQAMKVDDSGDGLRLLQEHLGHVKFDTTARYRKVAGKEQEGWFNKVLGGEKGR